jgi:hypothetical protein
MLDEDFARIRGHRSNIRRYRRLLGTTLSDIERQFIERRLTEEQTALKALAAKTFPVAFTPPKGQPASSNSGGRRSSFACLVLLLTTKIVRLCMIRGATLMSLFVSPVGLACAQSGRTGDDPRPCRF